MRASYVFVEPLPIVEGSGTQRFRHLVVNAINALQLPVSGLTEEEFARLGLWAQAKHLTPLVHVLARPGDWDELLVYLQLHAPAIAVTPGPGIEHRDCDGVEKELDAERTLLVNVRSGMGRKSGSSNCAMGSPVSTHTAPFCGKGAVSRAADIRTVTS